ncbi:MAG TPA: hypothetical protein PLX04_08125 [Caldisericia bacterium]|nr:hypothetical protein [Caldisericia bacterium]
MYEARKKAVLPIITEGLSVTVNGTKFGLGQKAHWVPGDKVEVSPDPGQAQAWAWGLAPYKKKEEAIDEHNNDFDRRESKGRRE